MKRYSIRADSGVSATGANIFESGTGYWVSYADHETALKEAVAKEREVWANAVAGALPPMMAQVVLETIRARGDA